MVWPDISRKIWSYIIAKLGVFTSVDPSKLELSSTSLSLTDVEVEPSKLTNSGITVTQCVIGKLSLELKYSGLAVNATNVRVNAKVNTLVYPDLAISTILETTKTDFAKLGNPDGPEIQESQPGMIAKLADVALAQVSANVSNIDINIQVNEDTMASVYIREAFMSSKQHIEIESVTVTRTDIFGESSSDSSYSEDEQSDPEYNAYAGSDPMAQSVFFDAVGSLNLAPAAHSASPAPVEMALVDRISFHFQFNPIGFDVEVDTARVDGLQALDFLVLILNEVIPEQTKNSDDDTRKGSEGDSETSEGDGTFTLHTLELYESLDSSDSPMVLSDLHFGSSRFSIAELTVPNIVRIAPFLQTKISGGVEISVDVPISAVAPLEALTSVKRIGGEVLSILKRLKPPEDAQPTPVIVRLPEIRVQIGDMLTVHVFPDVVTEKGMQVREITMIAANSQLAVYKINLGFEGSLAVESLKLKLSCGFMNELKHIASYIGPEARLAKSNKFTSYRSTSSPYGVDLPDFTLKIGQVTVDGYDGYFGGSGALDCKLSNSMSRLDARISCRYRDSEADVDINASSKDQLQSIESVMRVRTMTLDFKNTLLNVQDVPSKVADSAPLPDQIRSQLSLPVVSINFVFENDVSISVSDITTLTSIEHAKLNFDGSRGSLSISRICLDLVDPSTNGGGARVPLLKVKDISGNYMATLKIVIGRAALKVCADSYNFITDFSKRFIPVSDKPKFQLEPEDAIDVFEGVVESQFVVSNLKLDKTEKIADESQNELNIQDEYMGGNDVNQEIAAFNISRLLEVSTLWGAVSKVQVEVKRGQWQIYDGYDFQQTRDQVKDAIGRVTKVAKDLNDVDDSDDESDSTVVGDFMYNSLLITRPQAQDVDLRSKIATELGSSASLDRSSEPKLILAVRKLRVASRILSKDDGADQSRLSFTIRDIKVNDLIKSSQFNHMLAPLEQNTKQDVVVFTVDTVGPAATRELRVNLHTRPLRLSLDQDTVEFASRFFQFSTDEEGALEEGDLTNNAVPAPEAVNPFIQRFEFGGLPLVIDYVPKKVDYKSLRSGMAAELLNLFAVKGAKLALTPRVLHGVDGWDQILAELLEKWMPDIRANQLAGLLSGISPIRRALKVSKGVSNYTIVPIKRTQITKGAGVVVRRTLDELLRLRSEWLDSTDRASGSNS